MPNAPLTPRYASPEQVRGEAVTLASDVYQLGVLLYELLADRYPYSVESESIQALPDAICNQQPTRPSAVELPSASGPDDTHSVTTTRRWYRQLRGDLDTIVLMALRKEPARRYATAAEFSEDVRRYLAGQPVVARKDSVVYRTTKFVQRHRASIASITAIGISTGLLAWLMLLDSNQLPGSAPLENAIAVLPFEDRSSSDLRYLGDGIAGEVISGLATIPQLRVIARAASFSFRDSDAGIDEIADQLGVSVVVTGSVDETGGILRITAELTDTGGSRLWSQTYTQDGGGALTLQKNVVADLVLALTQEFGLELGTPGGASQATSSAEAYELYLLGQFHYLQRGEGVQKSIDLFKRSVELDPDFAHAWASLSAAYTSSLTWAEPEESVEELVRESATRAIQLNDTIGLAHMSLGGIEARKGNYGGGVAYLYKALAVSPNDPTVLTWTFDAMSQLGRSRESLEYAQRLHELNPIAAHSSYVVGWAHLALGDYSAAKRYCSRASGAGRAPLWTCLLFAHIESGAFDEAEAMLSEYEPDDAEIRPGIAYLEARRGRSATDIERALNEIDAALEAQMVAAGFAFYYYATLGDLDRAFSLLERRYDEQQWVDIAMWWLPAASEFRRDPRFMPLADRAGMTGFWRRHGWPDACGGDIPAQLCR